MQRSQYNHLIEQRMNRFDMLSGLWTPMTIGRSGFLGVESGGGPENQDENMDRGVHWVEISTLSLQILDM